MTDPTLPQPTSTAALSWIARRIIINVRSAWWSHTRLLSHGGVARTHKNLALLGFQVGQDNISNVRHVSGYSSKLISPIDYGHITP